MKMSNKLLKNCIKIEDDFNNILKEICYKYKNKLLIIKDPLIEDLTIYTTYKEDPHDRTEDHLMIVTEIHIINTIDGIDIILICNKKDNMKINKKYSFTNLFYYEAFEVMTFIAKHKDEFVDIKERRINEHA